MQPFSCPPSTSFSGILLSAKTQYYRKTKIWKIQYQHYRPLAREVRVYHNTGQSAILKICGEHFYLFHAAQRQLLRPLNNLGENAVRLNCNHLLTNRAIKCVPVELSRQGKPGSDLSNFWSMSIILSGRRVSLYKLNARIQRGAGGPDPPPPWKITKV